MKGNGKCELDSRKYFHIHGILIEGDQEQNKTMATSRKVTFLLNIVQRKRIGSDPYVTWVTADAKFFCAYCLMPNATYTPTPRI